MYNRQLSTHKLLRTNVPMKEKQINALSLLEDGKSVFLTGPGGVGKTAVMKSFAVNSSSNVAITSTTGTSALLLNGTTLHSFLGIGLGKESVRKLVDRITSQKWLSNRWRLVECLVIDEISMMHPDLFDKLEEVARIVRRNSDPFGGIQLALSGDFLQLPCIGTMNFCFQAKSWEKCVPNVVYLDEIIRQGDRRFPEMPKRSKNREYIPRGAGYPQYKGWCTTFTTTTGSDLPNFMLRISMLTERMRSSSINSPKKDMTFMHTR